MGNFLKSRFCLRNVLILLMPCILYSGVSSASADNLPFRPPESPDNLPATALIETEKGPFEIEFYRKEAPITVAGFVYLTNMRYYENLTFHRVVPDYIVQGGDPKGTGTGGPGWTLPPEFSNIKHTKGTVGMARFPGMFNPERRSNGSQFYITLSRSEHLDGLYTIFARVISGIDVVEHLKEGDRILRVSLPKFAESNSAVER